MYIYYILYIIYYIPYIDLWFLLVSNASMDINENMKVLDLSDSAICGRAFGMQRWGVKSEAIAGSGG